MAQIGDHLRETGKAILAALREAAIHPSHIGPPVRAHIGPGADRPGRTSGCRRTRQPFRPAAILARGGTGPARRRSRRRRPSVLWLSPPTNDRPGVCGDPKPRRPLVCASLLVRCHAIRFRSRTLHRCCRRACRSVARLVERPRRAQCSLGRFSRRADPPRLTSDRTAGRRKQDGPPPRPCFTHEAPLTRMDHSITFSEGACPRTTETGLLRGRVAAPRGILEPVGKAENGA